MEKQDIHSIWDQAKPAAEYSPAQINTYRKKQYRQVKRSQGFLIIFDIIMKSIIIAALVLLAILSEQKDLQILTLSIAALSLIFLVIVANIHSSYKSINIGNSIMENIKERLLFLEGKFNTFLIFYSLTNFLLVFTGFIYYQIIKYDNIDLVAFLTDPFMYLFPIVAFAISYFSQHQVVKQQITDLTEAMHELEDMDNSKYHSYIINKQKEKQFRNRLIAISLIFFGLVFLVLILLIL
ncbi:MAG: hypothetical protein CL663_06980 [Bacteroidetes bacterium]|nr:hypothetical protein [Bacteroidota bacterium]